MAYFLERDHLGWKQGLIKMFLATSYHNQYQWQANTSDASYRIIGFLLHIQFYPDYPKRGIKVSSGEHRFIFVFGQVLNTEAAMCYEAC